MSISTVNSPSSATSNMPGPTEESLVDLDVSGDVIPEGFAFVLFENDDFVVEGESLSSSQTEEARLAYVEDVFQGSSDSVTPWKTSSCSCSRIDINGAESRLLDSMKRSIDPAMNTCSRLLHKPVDSLQPSDFASSYLNRDWFILLYDYINARIEDPAQHATMQEILEMQRVWMLQCIYNTTAKNLFQDGSHWFYPVRRLNIQYNRFPLYSENLVQIYP